VGRRPGSQYNAVASAPTRDKKNSAFGLAGAEQSKQQRQKTRQGGGREPSADTHCPPRRNQWQHNPTPTHRPPTQLSRPARVRAVRPEPAAAIIQVLRLAPHLEEPATGAPKPQPQSTCRDASRGCWPLTAVGRSRLLAAHGCWPLTAVGPAVGRSHMDSAHMDSAHMDT